MCRASPYAIYLLTTFHSIGHSFVDGIIVGPLCRQGSQQQHLRLRVLFPCQDVLLIQTQPVWQQHRNFLTVVLVVSHYLLLGKKSYAVVRQKPQYITYCPTLQKKVSLTT